MKVLDLFCGTKSIASMFEARGHEVYTVDWDARTGTQGLKNNVEKARIPKALCEHIVNICEMR